LNVRQGPGTTQINIDTIQMSKVAPIHVPIPSISKPPVKSVVMNRARKVASKPLSAMSEPAWRNSTLRMSHGSNALSRAKTINAMMKPLMLRSKPLKSKLARIRAMALAPRPRIHDKRNLGMAKQYGAMRAFDS
jgi:hypothetical protein